jgi:hypothetical protein
VFRKKKKCIHMVVPTDIIDFLLDCFSGDHIHYETSSGKEADNVIDADTYT